ncbi:ubiquinone anaerobic biosynthesis accessory factor UbiT [Roseovarius salinarum]|uniref:ubiquinone anaerobic biosynthesis accessory factor UbiT n=1 Tax=Roseovarius salinarum TaxID=1981892 RepID=UPI000C322EAE|nr:SCP2 sterol-binding domain-containing protein [Roseovarius salinarum]
MTDVPTHDSGGAHAATGWAPPLPLFLLQPVLARVVRRVASRYPELLERLGPVRGARFLIDPRGLPFTLLLKPDPDALLLRACPRGRPPAHDALIAGRFLDLLELVDAAEDGDALFFSRELTITGDTEAVVTLRNALDNVEGSVAATVAGMFGPPGRAALAALRRAARRGTPEAQP